MDRNPVEGKLAETASKRPLALTIGAAAATLLVILGVLSGPAIVSCFNSEDGLGFCLRGKMAEVGLAPPLPAPATAEVETPAAAPEAEAEINLATAEEAVSAAPELDVVPPNEALDLAAADTVIAATFGLLRAEPDGSVVIAGSGAPGSRVEVFANGELLGTVEVEASGDWVFVPDAPLPPGDLEITLGEEGKTGTAEQSFIVVLNEDRTSQPLVVASTPGQASEVLQGLTAPAAEPATLAATDEPAAEPEATEVAIAAPAEQPVTPAEQPAAPVDEPAAATDVAIASTDEPAAPAEAPVAAADEPATDPAVETAVEPAMDVAVLAESEPVSSTPVSPAAEPEIAPIAEPAAEQPAAIEADTAPATVPAETPAIAPIQLADVQPTIDAIELEADRTFFAGGGPDEGIMRLYVDDGYVADTTVAEGRWLIEAGPVLDKPTQRVRIDLIQPDTGLVVARSEVDFVVDLPAAPAEQIVVADAEISQPPADAVEPVEAAEPVAVPAPAAEPEAPAVIAEPEAPAVIADAPVAEPVVQPEAGEEPAPAVPTMVAISLGDPEAQRFASGKAIIRRGDNLWTIARRVYGEGVKYTTIYQANNSNIRDPDRIYPGQVFDLPIEE